MRNSTVQLGSEHDAHSLVRMRRLADARLVARNGTVLALTRRWKVDFEGKIVSSERTLIRKNLHMVNITTRAIFTQSTPRLRINFIIFQSYEFSMSRVVRRRFIQIH